MVHNHEHPELPDLQNTPHTSPEEYHDELHSPSMERNRVREGIGKQQDTIGDELDRQL